MRLRGMIFVAMLLCMAGGLIAGACAPAIQATLTVQAAGGGGGTGGSAQATGTPPPTPGKTPRPTQPAQTPLPSGVSVIARDTFQRAAQVFWGTASDGHTWTSDANSIEIFSIASGAGLIAAGQGAFNAILGPASADVDVTFSASVNQFSANGVVNIGAVLRWTDGNDWYKALLNGTQLQILSRVRGVTTVLASLPFTAQGGQAYTLLFRALGANLLVKAWQSGQPEPANWLLKATDTALAQGMAGIRVVLQNTTTIRVTSFLETTVGATV